MEPCTKDVMAPTAVGRMMRNPLAFGLPATKCVDGDAKRLGGFANSNESNDELRIVENFLFFEADQYPATRWRAEPRERICRRLCGCRQDACSGRWHHLRKQRFDDVHVDRLDEMVIEAGFA